MLYMEQKCYNTDFLTLSLCLCTAHNDDNLELPSEDMNQCLINNQIIEETDDDKQSNSSPEVNIKIRIFASEIAPLLLHVLMVLVFVVNFKQHPWDFDNKTSTSMLDAGVDGSNLLIGSSMTICDDSSGDNSADTNVEELEPTIQNLDLDQKFNDAQSYLIDQIESGEISSDGGGEQRCPFFSLQLENSYDQNFNFTFFQFLSK